jgi:hypothetical protein
MKPEKLSLFELVISSVDSTEFLNLFNILNNVDETDIKDGELKAEIKRYTMNILQFHPDDATENQNYRPEPQR